MASSAVSQLQNYLAKLDDPSQTRKFLHKIYELRLTKDIIFQYGADLVLNSWTSHGTHGYLARRILEKWSTIKEEEVATPTSSTSNSSSDESTAPAPSAPQRKRARHTISGSGTKKYKVDSDYEETDEEYADEYELAIDEVIRRNREHQSVKYSCVHAFMKSSEWQDCKRRIADRESS